MSIWGAASAEANRWHLADRRALQEAFDGPDRRLTDRRVECPDCGVLLDAFDHEERHRWTVWADAQARRGWPVSRPTEMSERLSAAA